MILIFFHQFKKITFAYFEYHTITRIDLKTYDQDTNVPYVTFTFEERLSKRLFTLNQLAKNNWAFNEDGNIFIRPYKLKIIPADDDLSKAEYYIDKLYGLSYKDILNRTIFYKLNCHQCPFNMQHFLNESDKLYSIGLMVDYHSPLKNIFFESMYYLTTNLSHLTINTNEVI